MGEASKTKRSPEKPGLLMVQSLEERDCGSKRKIR